MNGPMAAKGPVALREGTVLDERYAVGSVLGRGGFGITYLVEDLARGDRAVVNELAPFGTVRDLNDDVDFQEIGPAAVQRLRHQFTAEARLLQRVRVVRVPQYRSVFHENQTAYFATDYIDGARPLTDVIGRERLSPEFVRRNLELLLETLEGLHSKGILHRDIRPSNVLLGALDEPYLVDFGSARQWHADLTVGHAVQFASEFAPLEQLSEKARRTPATDLYGLGATTYTLLTGSPPTSATARLEGAPLIPLHAVRPDVPDQLAHAVEKMLELHAEDRPQSVEQVRALLTQKAEELVETDRVTALDAKRRRLRQFRYDPMQCPACGEILVQPDPLPPEVCPVCRDGRLRKRKIEAMACPSCGGGVLRWVRNSGPLRFCPNCSTGRLVPQRRLFRETNRWQCEKCEFALERSAQGATSADGTERSWAEWRQQSGRQPRVLYCDACTAQFDPLADGRWQRMTPDILGQEWTRLYPDEWARVAAGLAPDAGNANCESCGSDFFIADGYVTLLSDTVNDPHGFAGNYCGELIPVADLPYLAVGKESGKRGLVCPGCDTEFDADGTDLTLVRTSHTRMRRHMRESHPLRDWHRIAQDLPTAGGEDEFKEDIALALVDAYERGDVDFDPKDPEVLWRGSAFEVQQERGEGVTGRSQRLIVGTDEVSFGGAWRKRRELVRDVKRVELAGDTVTLRLLGGEQWALKVEPVVLTFRLKSGRDKVELTAASLAKRLKRAASGGASESPAVQARR